MEATVRLTSAIGGSPDDWLLDIARPTDILKEGRVRAASRYLILLGLDRRGRLCWGERVGLLGLFAEVFLNGKPHGFLLAVLLGFEAQAGGFSASLVVAGAFCFAEVK